MGCLVSLSLLATCDAVPCKCVCSAEVCIKSAQTEPSPLPVYQLSMLGLLPCINTLLSLIFAQRCLAHMLVQVWHLTLGV